MIDIHIKSYTTDNKPYSQYNLEIDNETKLVEYTMILYQLEKVKEEIMKEADQIKPLMHAEETKDDD